MNQENGEEILIYPHPREKVRPSRLVKQGLAALGLTPHPDKTSYVGPAFGLEIVGSHQPP